MIGPFPVIKPSDDVALVVQAAAAGALFGTAVAAGLRVRRPADDTWLLVAAVTLLGAALGILAVAGNRLGWW